MLFLTTVMSASKLTFIYASLQRRDESRPRTKMSSLVLRDDFAHGSDRHRQSFLRQASSSSSTHLGTAPPSHDSPGSVTQQTVTSHLLGCVCAVPARHGTQTLIFQLFSPCTSEKMMDSIVLEQTHQATPHLPTQKSESCSFLVITPVLLLILD